MRTLVSLLSLPLLEKNTWLKRRPPTGGASALSRAASRTEGSVVVWKKLL